MTPENDIRGTDLLPANPFRPLDWRWRRAGQLIEAKARRRRWDDGWVAKAKGFLSVLARVGNNSSHPRLVRNHADVLGAYLVHHGEPRRRWELEARLLAGQGDDEVGGLVGMTPGAVEAYQAIYYEVRARLGAPDWVAARAIGRRLYDGFDIDDREIVWKALAYKGGPAVLDALIDHHRRDGRGVAEVGMAEQIEILIKLMATPVTTGNALDYLRLEALLQELDRAEADRSVSAVSNPIVSPPLDVRFEPEIVPLVRAGCARDGQNQAAPGVEDVPAEFSDVG